MPMDGPKQLLNCAKAPVVGIDNDTDPRELDRECHRSAGARHRPGLRDAPPSSMTDGARRC
jgi:hypothetical protein